MQLFADRADAGRQLAQALSSYARNPAVIVLALPRGGVPIGYEVARHLEAPLDVYIVRKLGVPGHEELAMGALASDGTCVVDDDLIRALRIDESELDEVVQRELEELRRRENAYGHARPSIEIAGKLVIVVDDGLATGASMRAAATALRAQRPTAIVAGVPVAAPRTCASLERVVDRVVCVHTPDPFHAVGLYYRDFEQTGDDEVRRLLSRSTTEL
ncbi:MAG: phosphoribosyltransferase [Candidatus Eremiobacteraeota bacterium]|nr:phosphoribosyltransferase [Candidatus Eremiobacteraeota bacterium]